MGKQWEKKKGSMGKEKEEIAVQVLLKGENKRGGPRISPRMKKAG